MYSWGGLRSHVTEHVSFWATLCPVSLCSVAVSLMIHRVEPEPFMDEIWHVPMAYNYCAGNYSHWDEEVTTLPGVYALSVALLFVLGLFSSANLCTVYVLRCTNMLVGLGNWMVAYAVATKLAGPGAPRAKQVLVSAAVNSLPILLSLTHVYYTDPGSVFFLLLMYLSYLNRRHWLAATFGAIAIFFRQSSVLWVAMTAGSMFLDKLEASFQLQRCDEKNVVVSGVCNGVRNGVANGVGKGAVNGITNGVVNGIVDGCPATTHDLPEHKEVRVRIVWKRLVDDLCETIRDSLGYVLVGLCFVAFLFYNDGIVVGDRKHHQMCFHPPQMGYFLLFTLLHAAPHMLRPSVVADFANSVARRPLLYAVLGLASVLAVQNHTHLHRYTLLDNRHLTFHVWTHVLGKGPLVRFCLVPAYVYAGYALLHRLGHTRLLWRVLFIACTFAATSFHQMLEFRYFIVPYVFFRLHVKNETYRELILELILNATVYCVMLYAFLARTVVWNIDGSAQSFFW
ncbi:dol-P-Glc:Glc(2)Man(9)GlcNAc(2)-PP-Dol alpha-1,2-glucosyltransferase-like [Amblyomma americanum]